MKTLDFDAEARYAPLGERHSAVIAPDISLDVYTADFDQVDFDTEIISGLRDQKDLEKVVRRQTHRASGWPPRNIARQDATMPSNRDNIQETWGISLRSLQLKRSMYPLCVYYCGDDTFDCPLQFRLCA